MNLPENISDDLKKYILDLANRNNALEKENQIKQSKIIHLENILFDFKRMLFGKKSEKIDPKDLYYGVLFNEPEVGLKDASTETEKVPDGHSETIHVKSFKRKKSGRKPLPDNLPREIIFHDIPESEKT